MLGWNISSLHAHSSLFLLWSVLALNLSYLQTHWPSQTAFHRQSHLWSVLARDLLTDRAPVLFHGQPLVWSWLAWSQETTLVSSLPMREILLSTTSQHINPAVQPTVPLSPSAFLDSLSISLWLFGMLLCLVHLDINLDR